MKSIILKNIISILAILLLVIIPVLSQADVMPSGNPPNPDVGVIKIKNPFRGADNIYELIYAIIDRLILPVGGVIAVLMIMWAGFLYVTARGNTSQIDTAHRALLYAAIGAAVLLGAKVISEVIKGTVDQFR